MVGDEGAGDVDPLLLAPRERHWREHPQTRGNLEPRQKRCRPSGRLASRHAERAQGLGDDLDGRYPRDHAQELAHVADRPAPHLEDRARLGADHVDDPVAVADVDAPRLRAIVAVDTAQQRALPRAGRIGQRHALAGLDGQAHAAQHRQLLAALGVQREGLVQALDRDGRRRHGWSTEDTRSCV